MKRLIFCSVVIFILSLKDVNCLPVSVDSDEDLSTDLSTIKQDVDSLTDYEIELIGELQKDHYFAVKKIRDVARENHLAPNYAKFIKCITLIEGDLNRSYNSTINDIQMVLEHFEKTEYFEGSGNTFEDDEDNYPLTEDLLKMSMINSQKNFQSFSNKSVEILTNCVTQNSTADQSKKSDDSTTKNPINITDKSPKFIKKIPQPSEEEIIKILDDYKSNIIFNMKAEYFNLMQKINFKKLLLIQNFSKNIECYSSIDTEILRQMNSAQDKIFKIIDAFETKDFVQVFKQTNENGKFQHLLIDDSSKKLIENILNDYQSLINKTVNVQYNCITLNLPADIFMKFKELHDRNLMPNVKHIVNNADDTNHIENTYDISNSQVTKQKKIINELYELSYKSFEAISNRINDYTEQMEKIYSETHDYLINEQKNHHDDFSDDVEAVDSCFKLYTNKLEVNYGTSLMQMDKHRQSIYTEVSNVIAKMKELVELLMEDERNQPNRYDDKSFHAKLNEIVDQYLEHGHSVQSDIYKIYNEFSNYHNNIIEKNDELCKNTNTN